MLMESLMMEEKKQLDFNRPLISIRRHIQTSKPDIKQRPPSPPVYKSDINSGPIRNPGTVPFQWEHKPGKPKDERKPELVSVALPKLPPGRIVSVREGEELVRKPESRPNHVEDAKSNSSWYDNESNDTYLDATDTLSRSESFFFNCSNVNGQGMLVEPFGALSSDRQTQDLMMGRFLPAAKALTSETPLHLARKPPKQEEPASRQLLVVKEKQNKAEKNPYRFHHSPDEDGEMSSMMASGVCGLLPQICLRSSFGVLNPVPSVRMQAQRGVSVRRMRSKYPCDENHKVKLDESAAEGEALSVSSIQEGKEKLENLSSASPTKVRKNFGELLASDDNTWEPSSDAPVVEKTLYVDTVHPVDKKVQEVSNEQSLLKEDVQNLIGASEEATSGLKVEECADQAIAEVVEITTKEKIDLEMKLQQGSTKNLESSRLHHHHHHHIVAPPPLPNAPSDSWLKRTLPTIPAKNNSFTWLQSLDIDDNNQLTKISQENPKWETMVKTSNTQQGFVCFSKETLNPIPET